MFLFFLILRFVELLAQVLGGLSGFAGFLFGLFGSVFLGGIGVVFFCLLGLIGGLVEFLGGLLQVLAGLFKFILGGFLFLRVIRLLRVLGGFLGFIDGGFQCFLGLIQILIGIGLACLSVLFNLGHFFVCQFTRLVSDVLRGFLHLIGVRLVGFLWLGGFGGFAGFFSRSFGFILRGLGGFLFRGIISLGGGGLGLVGSGFQFLHGFLQFLDGLLQRFSLFRVFAGLIGVGGGLLQCFFGFVEFLLHVGLAVLGFFLDGWNVLLRDFAGGVGEVAFGIKFVGEILLFLGGLTEFVFGFLGGIICNVTQLIPHDIIILERFLECLHGVLGFFLGHVHEALDHAELFVEIFFNAQLFLGVAEFFARLGDGLGVAGLEVPEMLGQQVEGVGHFALLLGGLLEGFFLGGSAVGLDAFLQCLLGGIGGLADHFAAVVTIARAFAAILLGHVLRVAVTPQCFIDALESAVKFLLLIEEFFGIFLYWLVALAHLRGLAVGFILELAKLVGEMIQHVGQLGRGHLQGAPGGVKGWSR